MEQITITAKVQIVATDTDKVLLNKTMSVYCDACKDVYKRQFSESVRIFRIKSSRVRLRISESSFVG